jgi:hypothetical protein
MQFKHGDRVTCTIEDVEIKDAKISIDKGWRFIQPPPTEEIKEMTVEEVSALVGKTVKIVEKK